METTTTIALPTTTTPINMGTTNPTDIERCAVAYLIRQGNTVGTEKYPFYLSLSDRARKNMGINDWARIADNVAAGNTYAVLSIFTKQKVRINSTWEIFFGSNNYPE